MYFSWFRLSLAETRFLLLSFQSRRSVTSRRKMALPVRTNLRHVFSFIQKTKCPKRTVCVGAGAESKVRGHVWFTERLVFDFQRQPWNAAVCMCVCVCAEAQTAVSPGLSVKFVLFTGLTLSFSLLCSYFYSSLLSSPFVFVCRWKLSSGQTHCCLYEWAHLQVK